MTKHKTDDKILIAALRILAVDIQSDDGIANACIFEAASRLSELTENHSPDSSKMVKLPTSSDEADCMLRVGYRYLQDHNPELLTKHIDANKMLLIMIREFGFITNCDRNEMETDAEAIAWMDRHEPAQLQDFKNMIQEATNDR